MSYELRDGSTASDPRLDRLPQWDDRNRDFPARSLLAPPQLTPRSAQWRCLKRLDQGQQGACVSFGWTHELIARPVEVPFVTTAEANSFAREQYFEMQKIDEWAGGAYPGAEPFYEGTSVLAGAKIHKSLGYITEYRWAFTLEDMILAVGHLGPVVIGVNWYTGMMDTGEGGYIRKTGVIEGGHCVMIRRVDLVQRFFGGVNSWGQLWGVNGFEGLGGCFRLSFDDMAELINEQGDVCVPVLRSL